MLAEGTAHNYRNVNVRFDSRAHYVFYCTSAYIAVRVQNFEEPSVQELLKSFAGKVVGNAQQALSWKEGGYHKGQFQAQFPLGTPPETVAQAMRDLLGLTRDSITKVLSTLAKEATEQSFGKTSVS